MTRFIYIIIFAFAATILCVLYFWRYQPSKTPTPYTATTSLTENPSSVISIAAKDLDSTKIINPPINKNIVEAKDGKIKDVLPNISLVGNKIMAWIYPGSDTCRASTEYSDGRKIDILKPEYFKIDEQGGLVLLSLKEYGCNGYSVQGLSNIKKYSKEQYVTVTSPYAGSMELFFDSKNLQSDIKTLVSFVVDNKMTGVEIDFEDYGGWNLASYSKYQDFIVELGNDLHKNNKKLMIDMPATSNEVEQAWYIWRYSDLIKLPIDSLIIMTYDYQFDQGVGKPVAPIFWIKDTIAWAIGHFPDKSKLSFGIPSYGYKGIIGTQKFKLMTYGEMKNEPGFKNAKRDSESYEMTWQNGDNIYFYQDSISMSKKLQTINNAGINSVSVWHMGGNLWFK